MNESLSPYFIITLKPGQSPRMIVHGFGKIDLNTISPELAFELWKAEFEYLEITDEGKAHFLTEEEAADLEKKDGPYTVKEVVKAINDACCKPDVEFWLSKFPDSPAVKKAYEKKLKTLK